MTITATIQNGKVICDSPIPLPNGTVVTVVPQPVPPPEKVKSLAERLPVLVSFTDDIDYPEDSSTQVDHYLYGTPKR